MRTKFLVAVILAISVAAIPVVATAAPITIGEPRTGHNCFPFGCSSGTRYQQVYDASSFSGLFSIGGVTFFNSDASGAFVEADYTLSLSTTSKLVDGLDTVNFNANLGLDNTLLFSGHLSGAVGLSFTLGGGGVFVYDPALGNLLIDIQVSNNSSAGGVYLDARNGDAGGLFSRAHNFGSGFEGYGLVTRFEQAGSTVPDPGSSLLLMGLGLAGLAAWKRRA